MAWAGGTFTRANGATEWQDDAAANVGIDAAIHDAQDNDLATGINNCLTKDGQNSATANLPMGGFKHTGASDATANGQYTTYNQLRDSSFAATLAASSINTTSSVTAATITKFGADVNPAVIQIRKSRNATIGGNTIVNNGDVIGGIDFQGNNGTSYDTAARIRAFVDGAPGAADMPGGITFSTTTDGGTSCPERMRINNAGNVGINTTDPTYKLDVNATDNNGISNSRYSANNLGAQIHLFKSRGATVGTNTIVQNGDALGSIVFHGANGTGYDPAASIGCIVNDAPGASADMPGALVFFTTQNASATLTERMRISNGGNVTFNTTGTYAIVSGNVVGAAIGATGDISGSVTSAAVFYANRRTTDGDLQIWYRDGVQVGAVSVATGTVTYGAFCGNHWSQLSDGTRPAISVGTVLETIDEMCEWPGETEERLPKVKISDTAASKAVYGVFMSWDNDWTATNDMLIASLGAYFVRVPAGTVLAIGDLLESAGNGMAQKQADDIIRSSTIGKVTALTPAHVEADGSFCVPSVLYCG